MLTFLGERANWTRANCGVSSHLNTTARRVIDIAPTILEGVGIEEPRSVNGTAQTPIQGKSFLASLEDLDTEEHRTSQSFELFANRGMCKDGWWAGSMAFEPWNSNRSDCNPLAAKWELYNLDEDFSQAHNLAQSHHLGSQAGSRHTQRQRRPTGAVSVVGGREKRA